MIMLAIAGAAFASTKSSAARAAFTGMLCGSAIVGYMYLAVWLAVGAP